MATKRRILLPQINGIGASSAAGAVGTLDLPLGYRYHSIEIVYCDGGASPVDMGSNAAFLASSNQILADVVLYRNGIAERTHTAAELDYLNLINGSQYGRQQVGTGAAMRQTSTIFLAEPWRKDKADSDYMAWSADGANGFNSFQLKLTIGYAVPATGSFVIYATVDAPLAPPSGGAQAVKKVYRQSISASGTANDITTLDARDAYQVIALKNPTGAAISKASLKVNGTIVFDSVNQLDNIARLVNSGLNVTTTNTPTTATMFGFPIVLDADDPLNSALPASGAALWLKLDYSTTASGNVVALLERLGPLD
jgi:hypothetical protein